MLKFLRISMTSLALCTLALAPMAVVLTADSVYAKNGKGDGGGKGGGGKGGESAGKGKGGNDKASRGKGDRKVGNSGFARAKGQRKGKSGGQGKLARGFKNDLKQFGRQLKNDLGLNKGKKNDSARAPNQTTRKAKPTTQKRVSKSAPVKSSRPPAMPARLAKFDNPLHPSNLGKLNGALNSSPNAKLAHIRNGNLNGPVGLAAALAIADAEAAFATENFESAQLTLALADAYDLIENAPTEEDIAAAQELIDNGIDDGDADIAAQEVLDYPDTTDAETLVASSDTRPTEDEVADALTAVNAGPPTGENVTAAEDAILAEYKGDLPAEERATVLDALRSSLPDQDVVQGALGLGDDDQTVPYDYDEVVEGESDESHDEGPPLLDAAGFPVDAASTDQG